ncbi:N-acetyltransferase [Aurantiacibacter rhizosphaerae]|uniref:N-acetyltransferase n=1 Tax=Aurantiacibacter rhizosphaerae TaxID=2691582 RepID=A0A844XE60_9SPHN|nr:N-acetyltransferase [Aurantiacibacter rhizosphaerae]MWV27775.1 N-acetyltransferase [Aurantiacibacter rhizosphaerae]
MTERQVTLVPAEEADFPEFKRELQAAFSLPLMELLGEVPKGAIPSDEDLDGMMSAENAQVLHILHDGRKVGGAVVTINEETQENSLDLLYMAVGNHSRGLGQAAWLAIEAMFPNTRSWETHTPYFEKRNIHFYVNVCGFQIVEYFHARHPGSHEPRPEGMPENGEMFRFIKKMTP